MCNFNSIWYLFILLKIIKIFSRLQLHIRIRLFLNIISIEAFRKISFRNSNRGKSRKSIFPTHMCDLFQWWWFICAIKTYHPHVILSSVLAFEYSSLNFTFFFLSVDVSVDNFTRVSNLEELSSGLLWLDSIISSVSTSFCNSVIFSMLAMCCLGLLKQMWFTWKDSEYCWRGKKAKDR